MVSNYVLKSLINFFVRKWVFLKYRTSYVKLKFYLYFVAITINFFIQIFMRSSVDGTALSKPLELIIDLTGATFKPTVIEIFSKPWYNEIGT